MRDPANQILSFDNPLWEQERILVFDLAMPDLARQTNRSGPGA